ncbi:MAG: spermidine/putrescine ABC transporter substrate-binding protein [Oscillospiraceae bacterium]|nr:spermidine/putrescine ABC transporter substrate-binding protein [Oscillospiraceae bacterium]
MKKTIATLLCAGLSAALLAGCGSSDSSAGAASSSSSGGTLTLNVYNWGEYISDGSEDSYDTVREFENWYQETYGQKVRVNYDTYASNEDMYAKLSAGAVSYDVVIPSDYMIARMASEGMLLPLDFGNIPNYAGIDDSFRGLFYDPDNLYTVPYAYGIVGVIYDANQVDEADAHGWELMWNEKYAGRTLQFNNPRDAFGTAMFKLGIDVNTTDKAEWDRAKDALMEQRPLRYGLVMDEIFNMMESGEAAIGPYYAGDYFTMADAQAEGVDLRFYYPEPTNYYIDAMCIPTCCQNKELAEIFINFMLSRDAAVANAEYTYYASPNRTVYTDPEYLDDLGEDTIAILYPGMESFQENFNRYAFRNLDAETLDYLNTLWENVKIN